MVQYFLTTCQGLLYPQHCKSKQTQKQKLHRCVRCYVILRCIGTLCDVNTRVDKHISVLKCLSFLVKTSQTLPAFGNTQSVTLSVAQGPHLTGVWYTLIHLSPPLSPLCGSLSTCALLVNIVPPKAWSTQVERAELTFHCASQALRGAVISPAGPASPTEDDYVISVPLLLHQLRNAGQAGNCCMCAHR